MNLYNTLTRKIEKFIPNNPEAVKMYTCGPTVYHYAHIGNLRSYIMEDVLEKALNYIGYNVIRCMNITDVGHLTSDSDSGEDKMLKGAKREHKTVMEIADMYTKAFFNDCEKLNIKKPQHIVKDLGKKNQSDFVLWFTKSKFDAQELKWESPWGLGYPGWHIECSGISISVLGEYLDIHCGGVDNIFPHHTNEIAQSEGYLGHKWCNYWFHIEHLNDETGKMSKSKGDFLTLSLLEEKGYKPIHYRFFCLQSHYRKQLLF